MSEPVPESPPEPAEPGFFTRTAEHLLPHLEHGEAEAGHIAADVNAALRDHAGVVFDVAGDFFAVLKLIDPADAPLAAAAEALLPKVLQMVEKATALASATLNRS
jgi:hypothetical protein